MEFILELIGAILEGILEAFLENDSIPKWIRYGVLTLLLGGFLALIVFALIAAGDWGLRIFLGILGAGLLAMMGYVFWKIFRYGIFQPAKQEDLPDILKLYRSVIGNAFLVVVVIFHKIYSWLNGLFSIVCEREPASE